MRNAIFSALALLTLAACSGRQNELQFLRSTNVTARELAIQPVEPLVMPASTALPAPTPGGPNRADPAGTLAGS